MHPDDQGAFTVDVAVPGTYRLCVDLYDRQVAPLPQFLLHLAPGMPEFSVKLPKPLLSDIPAGADVHYLLQQAPATPCEMTASTLASHMALYGPPDGVLACWYCPQPDKMVLWDAVHGTARTLTLRTLTFIPPVPKMQMAGSSFPAYMGMDLFPLLPLPATDWTSANEVERVQHSETMISKIRSAGPCTCNLWSGSYLIAQASSANPDIAGLLEVPMEGAATVTMYPERAYVSPREGLHDVELRAGVPIEVTTPSRKAPGPVIGNDEYSGFPIPPGARTINHACDNHVKLGIILPFQGPQDYPNAVTLTNQDKSAETPIISFSAEEIRNHWHPSMQLGVLTAELTSPPGQYIVQVTRANGEVLSTPVTVTEYGGVARFR